MWRATDASLDLVAGPPAPDASFRVGDDGSVEMRAADAVAEPVPESEGYFFEYNGGGPPLDTPALGSLIGRLLNAERETLGAAQELAGRYEEIDLLYTISEILGRTIGLEEAAEVIVREVSSVVGARRASIFVHDPEAGLLRPVAGWGIDAREFGPIPADHPESIAAKVFRLCRTIAGEAQYGDPTKRDPPRQQAYRGVAFLSVPITYPDSEGLPRPVGVINLTDRLGADTFSSGHRKLVSAIAHQIGAAIENARLVALDRQRQRVRRELELAHDLQLGLLPSPSVLRGEADVAARCKPGEHVGGDFFQFVPLPGTEVGVMLGDVSSHGFPAALIMALVLSAAGIHAAAADSPEEALERLLASVRSELSKTEMYLSLFYGVVDRKKGVLRYANAGHPHAFLLPANHPPVRLQATAPPLGLDDEAEIHGAQVAVTTAADILLLFSDGICEATAAPGLRFGEERLLEIVQANREQPSEAIVDAVFEAVNQFSDEIVDDRTLVVLKI